MAVTLLLLLLDVVMRIEAFKSGAPPSMCKDMMPHHSGSSPQTSQPPFSFVVEPPAADDGVVRVSLSGSSPFKGVMIEGRTTLDGDSVGQFINVPDNFQTLKCNDIPNNAVTHSESSPKDKIQVSWEAPDGFDDHVLFVASVVLNYTTYWTKIASEPTKVVKRTVGSSQDLGNTISENLYEGCGTRKNCLGSPVGCETKKDCTALVSVRRSGKDYEFQMVALKSKYVAVGLSLDDKMGGDAVVECAYESYREGFEGVNAYRSWNVPNQKAN
uniref:Reelin domain-containing protein n=2 Tax=Lygus hesperus TaxID=30085 RepID=A0A0K8SYV5_LYGHE